MLQDPPTVQHRRRVPSAVLLSLFALLQVLLIVLAFAAGYLFRETSYGDLFTRPKFSLLNEAFQLLKEHAYFPLPTDKSLEYGMIRGMLTVYNEPFTSFVDPPQQELQTQRLEGKYGGIGVRVERDTQNLVYLYPLPDSPALKAGVHDGDRLLKIEALVIGAETKNDEIQAAIRGPVGTKVKVTIGHSPDYTPLEVSIDRIEVALPSTTWNLVPNQSKVGIVHIQVIAGTTPDEVTKAIKDLQQQGATRFIIDVRNNGGGLVDAGVNLAKLFLKDGTVIEEQYRGQPVKSFKVNSPGTFANLPIVVLVNKGTASAAEIFSGALQGQKRAPLVGTHTYGKDTIQLVFMLSDGSSLHVTSAHWWVPGNQKGIGGKGLQPDIATDENADENQLLQAAVEAVLK